MYCRDPEPSTLRLPDYVGPGVAYHVAKTTAKLLHRAEMHTHDFAELFWIERGAVAHLINGERRLVSQGDVVLVRPEDVHTFHAHGAAEFVLANVAFASETLEFLRRRYFEETAWVWQGGDLPAHFRLDQVRLARLSELASLLAAGPPHRLLLERFLLELLNDLLPGPAERTIPLWLGEALRQLAQDPDALAVGVPALAALGGRSREHVNRVIRAATGRTSTALVNEIRLTRAAADLQMTDLPIARIAADSGVANLSHFYRLFNARFGVTPRRYRVVHQTPIRGSPDV